MEHIAEGGTIFLCSHILEVAERMCTRVAVIDQGRVLAAGTLDDLREDSGEDLEDIFIRLVGASVDEIEAKAGSEEEE
jgi:ABC-2 type transport system ATP-binding protein